MSRFLKAQQVGEIEVAGPDDVALRGDFQGAAFRLDRK
jgi:hypothetical protein